jgi:hypothetical protein
VLFTVLHIRVFRYFISDSNSISSTFNPIFSRRIYCQLISECFSERFSNVSTNDEDAPVNIDIESESQQNFELLAQQVVANQSSSETQVTEQPATAETPPTINRRKRPYTSDHEDRIAMLIERALVDSKDVGLLAQMVDDVEKRLKDAGLSSEALSYKRELLQVVSEFEEKLIEYE